MTSQHKTNPVTFRPPEGDRAWLHEHAKQTGQSVGSVLSEALAAYRASHEEQADGGDEFGFGDCRCPCSGCSGCVG